MTLRHGYPVIPKGPQDPEAAGPAQVTGGDAASLPDAGAAGEGPTVSGSPAGEPAITAEGAGELAREPEPEKAPEPEKSAPSEGGLKLERESEETAAAAVRRMDRVIGRRRGIGPDPDVEEAVAAVRPLARIGARWMGVLFIVVLSALVFASWLLERLTARPAAGELPPAGPAQ